MHPLDELKADIKTLKKFISLFATFFAALVIAMLTNLFKENIFFLFIYLPIKGYIFVHFSLQFWFLKCNELQSVLLFGVCRVFGLI